MREDYGRTKADHDGKAPIGWVNNIPLTGKDEWGWGMERGMNEFGVTL